MSMKELNAEAISLQVSGYFNKDNVRLYTGKKDEDAKTKRMLLRLLDATKSVNIDIYIRWFVCFFTVDR